MENEKIGKIIRTLRLEKKMTQKQLADKMKISDKTVSKWERGWGVPEISLIPELANLLEIKIEDLLNGVITSNDYVGGNMKNNTYYVCPACHNITICTGKAEVSCCGKKLTAQIMKKARDEEKLKVELIEDEWFITADHSMNKTDYISFVAFATGDRLQIIKQYPEWELQIRIPKCNHGMLIWYSLKEGLYYQLL